MNKIPMLGRIFLVKIIRGVVKTSFLCKSVQSTETIAAVQLLLGSSNARSFIVNIYYNIHFFQK